MYYNWKKLENNEKRRKKAFFLFSPADFLNFSNFPMGKQLFANKEITNGDFSHSKNSSCSSSLYQALPLISSPSGRQNQALIFLHLVYWPPTAIRLQPKPPVQQRLTYVLKIKPVSKLWQDTGLIIGGATSTACYEDYQTLPITRTYFQLLKIMPSSNYLGWNVPCQLCASGWIILENSRKKKKRIQLF